MGVLYQIRPATEADYDQIAAINRRAWYGGISSCPKTTLQLCP